MKKIETIIRTDAFPEIRSVLEDINIYSISKHDISGSSIVTNIENRNKKVFLSKIELIVGDKDANKVINTIAKFVENDGKIFVSDLNEIIDAKTFESRKDLEKEVNQSKRSRLVPLQKFTMLRAERFYNAYKERLHADYRIKSFSDFINYCVVTYLPIIEEEIKRDTIVENKF